MSKRKSNKRAARELDLLLRLTEIECMKNGEVTGNATGFFFLQERYLFLITNRHVVIGPQGNPPDQLRISLHESSEDLEPITQYLIPLAGGADSAWFELSENENTIDVVAIPLTDATLVDQFDFRTFGPDDLLPEDASLELGEQLLMLGFPLGFHDEVNHLPVARTAFVATAYDVPFQGQPTFLTDGRMHRGSSGSPAVVFRSDRRGKRRPLLAGVHSAAYDMSNRDPSQDDRLALNTVWRTQAIRKIVAAAVEAAENPNETESEFSAEPLSTTAD